MPIRIPDSHATSRLPPQVYIQCALLYTTPEGHRRIRVHTMGMPTTSVLGNLFRAADLDAQFSVIMKNAAEAMTEKPLPQIREKVLQDCVNTLYTYRKFCATTSSSGQLILPEALKLLPLYTLALNKVWIRIQIRIRIRIPIWIRIRIRIWIWNTSRIGLCPDVHGPG